MNRMNTHFFGKNLLKICLAGFLLAGLVLGIQAEETLTLEQARALAEANSNTLRSASLEMNLTELESAALRYEWYPDISLSGSAGTSGTDENSLFSDIQSSAGVSLKQQVWDGGKYILEKNLAGIEAGVAASEWQSIVLSVRNECDEYFFNYLEALSQESAATADVDAANSLLEEAESKLEAGIIARLAYLEIKADAASKETELLKAQQNTIAARTELTSFLGLDELPEIEYSVDDYNQLFEILAELEDERIEEISMQLVALGLEKAPDLLKAKLTAEKAELNAAIDKNEYAPTVSLSVSDEISVTDFSNSGSVSISASITLSQWKRKNTASQAAITVEQASLSSSEVYREYVLSVESGWHELLSSFRTAISAGIAREYAEELYKETLEMYELSAKSLSDLTDAKANLISNRNTYTSARFDFLKSVSSLVYLLGLENEAPLWEIVSL